jgi:hypothetical protein
MQVRQEHSWRPTLNKRVLRQLESHKKRPGVSCQVGDVQECHDTLRAWGFLVLCAELIMATRITYAVIHRSLHQNKSMLLSVNLKTREWLLDNRHKCTGAQCWDPSFHYAFPCSCLGIPIIDK